MYRLIFHLRPILEPKHDLNPEMITGMELSITGLFNDRFASQTSENVRRTLKMKREKGEFVGAFAPYGYNKHPVDKNKLVIDPLPAEVVSEMFSLFVHQGYSLQGIVRHLNERGIMNPSSYKRNAGAKYHNPNTHRNDGLWSVRTVRHMLTNPMYIGFMVQGRTSVISYKVHDRVPLPKSEWCVIEGTHEPIVAREDFDKAQSLLTRDTRAADQART